MDSYIKERLERAEMYFKNALGYSRGTEKPPGGWDGTQALMIRANLKAALDQFKKIERYINQCGTQAKEDADYINVIK